MDGKSLVLLQGSHGEYSCEVGLLLLTDFYVYLVGVALVDLEFAVKTPLVLTALVLSKTDVLAIAILELEVELAVLLLMEEKEEVGVDEEGGCVYGYLGNETDLHWLYCLHFLLLQSLLALHHLYHVLQHSTLPPFLVQAVTRTLKEKLVGTDIDYAVVECLQLFNFVAELMLAESLECKSLLGEVGEFDVGVPCNGGGVHHAIVKSLILLVIVAHVDDSQMGPGDVPRVLLAGLETDVFEAQELFCPLHLDNKQIQVQMRVMGWE